MSQPAIDMLASGAPAAFVAAHDYPTAVVADRAGAAAVPSSTAVQSTATAGMLQ